MGIYSLTDGTTNVDLDGGYSQVLDYLQGSAEIETRVSQPLADGANLQGFYRPVTESFELLVSGTQTQILATIRSIQTLLKQAIDRQVDAAGARVYLQQQLSGETLKRSEVLSGKLGTESVASQLWRGAVELQLTVTRAYYWEKATEDELQLTSSGFATPATGGRTITNDGVANWVAADASQILGDLPAPVRFNIQNTSGSSQAYRAYWIGVNQTASPATFTHYIQGETGLTPVNNAAYSGGQYAQLSFTATEPVPYTAYWRLPAASMAAAGQWFRLLVRLGAVGPNVRCRVTVLDYFALNILWRSTDFLVATGINDFGAIPLPPGGNLANYAQICIGLSFWSTAPGSLYIDYLNMFGPDRVRRIDQPGMTIPNNDSAEIDEIAGAAYSVESGLKHSILFPTGSPLFIRPGKTARFYVAYMPDTITLTTKVRVYYRPRYMSV